MAASNPISASPSWIGCVHTASAGPDAGPSRSGSEPEMTRATTANPRQKYTSTSAAATTAAAQAITRADSRSTSTPAITKAATAHSGHHQLCSTDSGLSMSCDTAASPRLAANVAAIDT